MPGRGVGTSGSCRRRSPRSANEGACCATCESVATAVSQSRGGCRASVEPGGVGVGCVEDLVELSDLLAVVLVEPLGQIGIGLKVAGADLEAIEVFLVWCAVGPDGGDGSFGVVDRFRGVGGVALCGASVTEAGAAGLTVGFPHGRAELAVQLLFEVADGSGVGLPRLPGGIEKGLELVQLVARGGSSVLSVGETVDQLLAPVVEPLTPRLHPVGEERIGLGPGRRAVTVGEVAALGDGGDVGPVVGQDALEDVTGLAQVGGLGDDVDPVLVPSAGGGDVEAAVGGGCGGRGRCRRRRCRLGGRARWRHSRAADAGRRSRPAG